MLALARQFAYLATHIPGASMRADIAALADKIESAVALLRRRL
jgi:hypothetical protein